MTHIQIGMDGKHRFSSENVKELMPEKEEKIDKRSDQNAPSQRAGIENPNGNLDQHIETEELNEWLKAPQVSAELL